MSLIDKAVSHFDSKARRELNVPEWDVVLYTKNLTLDDKAKWLARADGDTTDYMVYACIFGLVDAKGEPVFTLTDKHKLRTSVDPDIISKLATFVLHVESDSEEAREKN